MKFILTHTTGDHVRIQSYAKKTESANTHRTRLKACVSFTVNGSGHDVGRNVL